MVEVPLVPWTCPRSAKILHQVIFLGGGVLNSDWRLQHADTQTNKPTDTHSPHPGFNLYRRCWCCYGLLWCWSDLILHQVHTRTHIQQSQRHICKHTWNRNTSTTSNTVLNCLHPFFVFYSFFLVHFILSLVAYCIDKSYIDFHTNTLSIPLLQTLPNEKEKCTLLLLYHTTVLLNIEVFSH